VEGAAVGLGREEHVGRPEVVVGSEGERAAPSLLVEVLDKVVVGRAEVGLVGGRSVKKKERMRKL
jgi:hypothetical protein